MASQLLLFSLHTVTRLNRSDSTIRRARELSLSRDRSDLIGLTLSSFAKCFSSPALFYLLLRLVYILERARARALCVYVQWSYIVCVVYTRTCTRASVCVCAPLPPLCLLGTARVQLN